MSWDIGDTATLTVTVDPADGTTSLTFAATSPTGITSAPAATPSVDHATWTGSLLLNEAGDWVVVATITGTGLGVQTLTLHVAPLPTQPIPGSYATSADYAAYTDAAPPSGIAALLRRCSRQVDRILLTSVYDATDTDVIAALRDATCEQAVYHRARGNSAGIATGYSSVAIGSVKLDKGAQASGSQPEFSPDAFTILQLAGLTGGEVLTL